METKVGGLAITCCCDGQQHPPVLPGGTHPLVNYMSCKAFQLTGTNVCTYASCAARPVSVLKMEVSCKLLHAYTTEGAPRAAGLQLLKAPNFLNLVCQPECACHS